MATQSELDNLAGKWFVGMYGIANEYSFILAASKAMPNSSDEDKIFKISYISLMPNFIKLKEGTPSNIHMFNYPVKGTDDLSKLNKKAIKRLFRNDET